MPKEETNPKYSLESKKREVLLKAIHETLPMLARENENSAQKFAKKLLEDIRLGNNQDLEKDFWEKIKDLILDFDDKK